MSTENTNKPADESQLSDDMLEKVAGGSPLALFSTEPTSGFWGGTDGTQSCTPNTNPFENGFGSNNPMSPKLP